MQNSSDKEFSLYDFDSLIESNINNEDIFDEIVKPMV